MEFVITMANSDLSDDKLSRITKRFMRASNMKITTTDETIMACSFDIPGFKYDDFDRFGHLSLYKLSRIFESGRFAFYGNSNMNMFMCGLNMEISHELYERAAIIFPMRVERRMNHVGKSSLSVKQAIIDVATQSVLATRTWLAVRVDLATKKPRPIPNEYREKYAKVAMASPPQLVKAPGVIQERAFTCSITVRLCDTDLYGHATQGSYVLFAIECAERAKRARFYRTVREELSLVSRLGILFVSETLVGDELAVTTWDDGEVNPLCTRFVMKKVKNGSVVCHVEMEYHAEKEQITSRL